MTKKGTERFKLPAPARLVGLSKASRHRLNAPEVDKDSINEMSFKRHFLRGENESPIRRQLSRGKTNPLRNSFLLFHPRAL